MNRTKDQIKSAPEYDDSMNGIRATALVSAATTAPAALGYRDWD